MSHLTALPDSSTSSSASVSLKTVFDFFARISKPAPVDGLYLFADLSARFTTFSAPIGCIYPSSALLYLRLRLFRPLRSHHIPKLGTDRLLSFSSTTTLIKIAPDLSDRMTYTPYDCRRLLIRLPVLLPYPFCECKPVGSFACSGVPFMVPSASVVPATESRDIVRYLRN